jgi:hypothetical protein
MYPAAQQMPPQQMMPGAPMTQCRICGCVPAAEVTFREHHGLIIIMQYLRQRGPFCRTCGLAVFRTMTAKTLLRGWYGYISMIATPVTVVINLVGRAKVASLPPPVALPGAPDRPRLDPGAPLLARPTALIGLAIPVVVILIATLVASLG